MPLFVGAGLSGAVALSVILGSAGLRHFDPAVTLYTIGSILAAFALGYRFTLWAQRPPSRMYFRRGLEILLKQGPRALSKSARTSSSFPEVVTLAEATGKNFVAQRFIHQRSLYRWIMHLCLSGGCTLAFAITFPLVFGWIHFTTPADNPELYQVHLFGFQVDQFPLHGIKAFLMFNVLNIAALIVLVGLGMAGYRRLTDAGERATQSFIEDLLPLILIFAVTATGLMLTVSYKFLGGAGHQLMAIVHMWSVLVLLFYIPFGKLFHMFQRSCSLCVSLYKKAGQESSRAHCVRCGEDYASQMHVDDLKIVLDQVGFNYRYSGSKGEVHYQDICPACRRSLLALNQGRTLQR